MQQLSSETASVTYFFMSEHPVDATERPARAPKRHTSSSSSEELRFRFAYQSTDKAPRRR